MFVGLAEHLAVDRVLVGAQRIDGRPAVVDNAVEEAELGRRSPQLSHADVDADVGQAALPCAAAQPRLQPGLQLLGAGLGVATQKLDSENAAE